MSSACPNPSLVAIRFRDVIGDQEARETCVMKCLDGFEGVDAAFVYEALVEAGDFSLDEAEMDVGDSVSLCEVADRGNGAIRVHLRPTAHTEVQFVMRAVELVDPTSEFVETPKDSSYTAK